LNDRPEYLIENAKNAIRIYEEIARTAQNNLQVTMEQNPKYSNRINVNV
jgi:hypothetical protein